MSTPATLPAELGLAPGTSLIEWRTAWSGTPVVSAELTNALVGYTVTAGRGDVDEHVQATTCAATLARELLTAVPEVGAGVQLAVTAAAGDALGLAASARPRFTGEVVGRSLDDDGRLVLQLVGRRSRLGRLYVGDTPWAQETAGVRVQRILDLARAQLPALQLGTVDADAVQVIPRDVDRQPALALLDELAETTTGQLVELRDGTLTWHDAEHRRNPAVLVELVAGRQIVAGLRWESGLAGMVNDLTLAYGLTPAEGEQPTVRQVDDVSVAAVGVVAASESTLLADKSTAEDRARLIVGRRSTASWSSPALTVELLRSVDRAQLAGLLRLEHGNVLRATGLPAMSPFTTSELVVEGYTETLTRDAWLLDLAVAGLGIAGAPLQWQETPAAITWAGVTPAGMTWLQAAQWQPYRGESGRWHDVAATLRWSAVPASTTWANYV